MEDTKQFLFIGDILRVNFCDEYEILPCHILKRANSKQIEWIRQCMPENNPSYSFTRRYEIEIAEKSGGTTTFYNLDEHEWNYWIIEYDGTYANDNIEKALLLCKADLHVIFEKVYAGGRRSKGIALQTFLADNSMEYNIKVINECDLHEIKNIVQLIENFNNAKKDQYKYINKALIDFNSLGVISRWSPFMIVAIFSILETLLVHNPQRGDNSITQQLKTKLNLLNNRFEEKIDFRTYFNGANTNTFELIVEKLYSYRSDIAHGDFTDFNKELSVIVGYENSFVFLYTLVKKVILQALKEPRLIDDLKQC